jgi:pSer/pThr/pTyr-binding forkhead associated (FHA) protein
MDPNATRMFEADPNRTQMASAPSLNVTQTIAPVQCPICKTFNPAGEGFCVECGLIFQSALPEDAFGAPAVHLPCLVDSSGSEHFLRPGANLVGREGDVLIQDGRVSRRHAEITLDEGRVSVRDLGSSNGTTANGEPVGDEPVVLADGDEVVFAGNAMTLSVPGAAGATQALPKAEEPAPTAAFLVIGDDRYDLKKGDSTIGRRGENDIVLEDPYVSGAHAKIQVADSITLTDLGSTNGTFVGGVKLSPNEPMTVTPNDEIIIGRTEAKVENV